MDQTPKSRRPWLMLVVVAMAALGAWYSLGCIQKLVTKPRLPDYSVSTYVDRPRFTNIDPGTENLCTVICNNFLYTPYSLSKKASAPPGELGHLLDVRVLDIRYETNEQIADRYRMRVLPTVLLLDGTGRELWRHEGYIGFTDLRGVVSGKLPGLKGK